MEGVYKSLFGIFLLAAAWEDVREKAVSVWVFEGAGRNGGRAFVKLYGRSGTSSFKQVNK